MDDSNNIYEILAQVFDDKYVPSGHVHCFPDLVKVLSAHARQDSGSQDTQLVSQANIIQNLSLRRFKK